MIARRRRAERGDRLRDAGLMQADHVHVAFDDDQPWNKEKDSADEQPLGPTEALQSLSRVGATVSDALTMPPPLPSLRITQPPLPTYGGPAVNLRPPEQQKQPLFRGPLAAVIVFAIFVVLAIATLGPIGRRLPAPGTWGSLAGLLYFTVVFAGRYEVPGMLLLSALGLYVSVAFCGEAEFRIGRKDPGEVILDEFVVMPLCFLGWPAQVGPMPRWAVLLAGFALFRLFDILKPFGISKLQDLPGGWGVVIDDVAAALAACGTLHLIVWIWRMKL